MMLSSFPKLTVKRHYFEPEQGENAEQYRDRCRKIMGEMLEIPCTEGGFREKI
jgi:hypothetical protein